MADSSFPEEDKEVEPEKNLSTQEMKSPTNPKSQGQGEVFGGEESDETDGPTSSVGNIIPLDKLKNGWFALSTFMTVSIANSLILDSSRFM